MIVKIHPMMLTNFVLTKGAPMMPLLFVATMSGMMLRGKAMLKNTCVNISKSSIRWVSAP